MPDVLDDISPIGVLGKSVDKLFQNNHMMLLLTEKDRVIKEFAVSPLPELSFACAANGSAGIAFLYLFQFSES